MIFGVRLEPHPTGTVLRLHGEADLAIGATLRDAVREAVDRARPLIVDCTDLSYIDCAQAAVLLEARATLAGIGCELTIVHASRIVERMLEFIGLGSALRLAPTGHPGDLDPVADAAAALRSVDQRSADRLLDRDFLAYADREEVLTTIVDTAVAVGRADACDVQLLDLGLNALLIEAQYGFPTSFLDHFAAVGRDDRTACAAAMRHRAPVVVRDVTASHVFDGTDALDMLLSAGSRAVESHPLFTPTGRLMGVVSLHYRAIRPPVDSHHNSRAAVVARAAAAALSVRA
jgi:anti-anti-sigma factor